MPTALLIVDVQRDFCPGGALPAHGCGFVVPAVNGHIQRALAQGLTIYASRDWHPAVTTHFAAYGGEWPPHCVQGTAGADFEPGLELPPDTIVVTKGDVPDRPGYSAFEGRTPDGAPLVDDLRRRGIDTVYVAGLTTDYCVKETALDARAAGFRTVVLVDAIAGIDAHPGDVDRAFEAMRAAGVELTHEILPPSSAMAGTAGPDRA